MATITTLFLDIGGVLLTNGWDHVMRQALAKQFGLDFEDLERRHHQFYNSHETDEITLDDYFNKVVFWTKRSFTLQQFKDVVYAQSQPLPGMLRLMRDIKQRYGLTVAIVSNEGRDLAEYRIKTFELDALGDLFIVSCFIHLQKPDPRFYRLALDVSQVSPGEVLYVDDRIECVEAARKLGIRSIQHLTVEATRQELELLVSSPVRR